MLFYVSLDAEGNKMCEFIQQNAHVTTKLSLFDF